MHKDEPKVIINLNLDSNQELIEKVELAVDKYVDALCDKNVIDEKVEKAINDRIDYMFGKGNAGSSYKYSEIKYGIEQKIHKYVNEAIDDVIVKLIAKKLNDMIKESSKEDHE